MVAFVRPDALPERTDYAGTKYYAMGCDVNPVKLGCLSCPLPVCKYDRPTNWQMVRRGNETRDKVLRLAERYPSKQELAKAAGVSMRTVHRIFQMARSATA